MFITDINEISWTMYYFTSLNSKPSIITILKTNISNKPDIVLNVKKIEQNGYKWLLRDKQFQF